MPEPEAHSSGINSNVLEAFGSILQGEVDDAEQKEKVSEKQLEDLLIGVSEALQKTVELKHDQEQIKKRLENADLRQNIKFRSFWTKKIYKLIICWLWFLGGIIILNGLKDCFIPVFYPADWLFNWHLADSVMIAVLGTTTVTVIGLFGTVTGHFFNRGPSKGKDKS